MFAVLALIAEGASAQLDAGSPPATHTPFVLPFEATDVIFDGVRGLVYASSKSNKRVYFIDAETGLIEKQFDFTLMPEHLAITPDGSRLFVALLTREHSSYWWDGDHEGMIASFDLDLQVKDRQFWIGEDPFGLVATSNGQLVVSSGSGQWTYIRVFDAQSGAELGADRGPRERTRLALHPSEDIIYGANNGITPSDIERYDLSDSGTIDRAWDSIYHGDHRMGGNVWASPLGDVLITRGGDVFSAAGARRDADMIYLRGLTASSIDALGFDVTRKVIVTGRDNELAYYNLHTLERIASQPISGDVSYVGVHGLDVYAVQVEVGETRITRFDHPLPNGDTDTPPTVSYEIAPTAGFTTLTDITFDASGSSDSEGGLVTRWDLDGDGVWDGEFADASFVTHRFDTAGTKFLRVQVKDVAGWVAELSFSIDVAFEADPGNPGEAHPGFTLPFPLTHAVFDPERPYVYASSKDRKRVYFLNLETGFIEKQFDFTLMPEHLAITPDGSRLFVALLSREHSSYWWDGDHEGMIASFDLDLQVKDRQFSIAEDPFGLVATSNGQLVVSSGSGQWTYIRVFDAETGAELSADLGVRQGIRLALHPSEDIVYGAGNGIWPADIERYDLSDSGAIERVWDSIYHGQHRMGGNVWVNPDGESLISAGGDVFSAAGATRDEDMIYLRGLTPSFVDALSFDPDHNAIITASGTTLSYYNLHSLEWIADQPATGDVRFLRAIGDRVYAVSGAASASHLEVLTHLVPGGGSNSLPVAALEISPDTGITTMTDVAFDASVSADAEGGLVYRWDFDGDEAWDDGFAASPLLIHRFDTAGTKVIRLQVKDGMGAVAEISRTIDVAFEADPGDPGEAHPGFTLQFPLTHAVFDPERPYVYVSSKDRKRVYFVNLETGFIEKQFDFALMPEHLAITPDGSRLFVALLTREHSAYWPDGEHEGAIASFDLDLQVKDRQFRIAEDPFGLVATSNGQLVVSSGSGQWTYIRAFDAESGAELGTCDGVQERTRLTLHPSEDIVYGADNGISPSDIQRYDLSDSGSIGRAWDSVYHGDHRMNGNLWASPLGNVLITRGGDVFSAAGATRDADMIYLRGLSPSSIDALGFDVTRNIIVTGRDDDITYYNLHTLERIASQPMSGDVSYVGVRGLDVYAAQIEGDETRIRRFDHPLPNGDTDAPPTVSYEIAPSTGFTTLTDITLDASGSSDSEGGLLTRWDLDGDGVWDGEFADEPFVTHRFDTAGTKLLRVQVKDVAGWVAEISFSIDVAFEADPGSPGEAHPGFTLPFPLTHAVFDPERPYVYVSSMDRKRVYFVNLETGFIERQFDFTLMPEHLAITPDGSRLFVALLSRQHSSQWWDGDHEGMIASFDLDLQVKDRQFSIAEDPFGLVATSNGQLVVSSGSGQWTYIRVFDAETGTALGADSGVRQATRLALHPSEDVVYGADNGISPSDIERYDLYDSGAIDRVWDSIYHGQHRMGGNVWVSPDGRSLISAGGDVYTAGASSRDTDIIYLRTLGPGFYADLKWSVARDEIAAIDRSRIFVFDMNSYAQEGSFDLTLGEGRFLGRRGPFFYALEAASNRAFLEIFVHGNQAPVAVATQVAAVECESAGHARVELDGRGSFDSDDEPGVFHDIVSYSWSIEDAGTGERMPLATGEVAEVTLPVGAHRIWLTVADRAGQTGLALTTVEVVDTIPPSLHLAVTPMNLWPPNHRMVDISAVASAADSCRGVSVVLDSITSEEPDNGVGDGNTADDIQGAHRGTRDYEFLLRAERSGTGDGREYRVTYQAVDEAGNSSAATSVVRVEHDQGGEPDQDGDGLTDAEELALSTSLWDADSDDDGSLDAEELLLGSDPNDPSSFAGPAAVPSLGMVARIVLSIGLAMCVHITRRRPVPRRV